MLTIYCTAFQSNYILSSGPLIEVALAIKTAIENNQVDTFLVFNDETGKVIDLDLRGTKTDVINRLSKATLEKVTQQTFDESTSSEKTAEKKIATGRGRPKLGVISKEVTLLPRHWEWLAAQSSGASAAIRRLVDEARKKTGTTTQKRTAQEAAYHFMTTIAGDFPYYEEATRALFADDRAKLEEFIAQWPQDIRTYLLYLCFGRF